MAREVASVMVHCGWEPLPVTAPTVRLSPTSVEMKKGRIEYRVYVDVYDGERLVPYSDAGFSTLGTGSPGKLLDGVMWSFGTEDNRFYYIFRYIPTEAVNADIPFTVTYNGTKYPGIIPLRSVADGEQGIPGRDRKPPRVREWGSVPVGDELTTGLNETDDWTDVVYIRDEEAPAGAWYWQCIKDFTKQNGQIPPDNNSDTGNDLYGYLRKTSNYAALATDLFFATFALIKNLGVETIDMRDGSGNILFQAKDGVVTCNTGNFRNIHISGNSTFRGFVFHEKTEITAANYASMSITKTYAPGYSRTELDLMKTGNWIEIKSLPATDTFHYTSLPAIRTGEAYTDAYRDYVRQFMGNEIMIYNTSGKSIAIDTGENSVEIRHENACYFRMVMAPETSNNSSIKLERIKWEYTGPFQY